MMTQSWYLWWCGAILETLFQKYRNAMVFQSYLPDYQKMLFFYLKTILRRINFFYLLRTFCPHLGKFFFVLFLLSLRFGQISPLAFFRWFLPRPRIGMMSLVTVSPVITAFHSWCLSHHVFDQVNLWPAWVGFEAAIFWQCSLNKKLILRLRSLISKWFQLKDNYNPKEIYRFSFGNCSKVF